MEQGQENDVESLEAEVVEDGQGGQKEDHLHSDANAVDHVTPQTSGFHSMAWENATFVVDLLGFKGKAQPNGKKEERSGPDWAGTLQALEDTPGDLNGSVDG